MPQAELPSNAACSAPPDGSLDFRSALDNAQRAFNRLFPAEAAARGGALFATPPRGATEAADPAADSAGQSGGTATGAAEAEDSDDETLAALEAALQGIGSS